MANVLVVEDDPGTNRLLCSLLSKHGHQCAGAQSGEAALESLSAAPPDLAIVDFMMPGMDGLEVLRAIRGNPRTATLPVIVFSAIADPEFIEHAKRKGANDYWIKGAMDLSLLGEMIARQVSPSSASP